MSVKIEDDFSDVASKHTRWELRRVKEGLCRRCGKRKPAKGKTRCASCLAYCAKWARKQKKQQPMFKKLSHAGQRCKRI